MPALVTLLGQAFFIFGAALLSLPSSHREGTTLDIQKPTSVQPFHSIINNRGALRQDGDDCSSIGTESEMECNIDEEDSDQCDCIPPPEDEGGENVYDNGNGNLELVRRLQRLRQSSCVETDCTRKCRRKGGPSFWGKCRGEDCHCLTRRPIVHPG